MLMGQELATIRCHRADRIAIGPHHAYLHEYLEFRDFHGGPGDDADGEWATWPEDVIDQRRMGRFSMANMIDDAEEDDHAGGDVCDEPHDPREEDGE